jgi:hypothetical protein
VSEQKTPAHWPPDRELSVKAIVGTGLALLLATALAGLLVWWVAGFLTKQLDAQDAPRPVLLEAQAPYEPPGPRLSTNPAELLRALRAEEDTVLGSYGWVDETNEIVHVPIDSAMEMLLETNPEARAFGDAAAETVEGESQ